jgi:hypothetical protein
MDSNTNKHDFKRATMNSIIAKTSAQDQKEELKNQQTLDWLDKKHLERSEYEAPRGSIERVWPIIWLYIAVDDSGVPVGPLSQ